MGMVCPLCRGNNIDVCDSIKIVHLAKLYEKFLTQDISAEFKSNREITYHLCKDCDLRYFFPPITGSDQFYNLLNQNTWYYLNEKNEYQFASNYIRQGDHVLDIGCGSGLFSEKIPSSVYTGLELNRQAMLAAQEKGVRVLQSTIEEHARNNSEAYDVVTAFQVIEHVSDIKSFIESSINCLKEGGCLILSVPSVNSFSRFVQNFVLDMPPHHLSRWTDAALTNIKKYFPLEVIEIWHEPLQDVHKEIYMQTVLTNSLFLRKRKLIRNIDLSLPARFVNWIGWQLGKIVSRGLIHSDMYPRGISVTGVYRKISK